MLQLWLHPALIRQSAYMFRTSSRLCIQLSHAVAKDHFIHHSDSQAIYSVIQCHHIGPFHTPLGPDSRSYVPDSMTKIILQWALSLRYRLFLFSCHHEPLRSWVFSGRRTEEDSLTVKSIYIYVRVCGCMSICVCVCGLVSLDLDPPLFSCV